MSHSKNGFPLLLTDRLNLRAPIPGDCDDFHKLLLLPEVTRFSNWPDAPKRSQAERSMKWMCEAYAKGKGCAWMTITVSGLVALRRRQTGLALAIWKGGFAVPVFLAITDRAAMSDIVQNWHE